MERISQSQLIMLLILIYYGTGAGFLISGLSEATGYAVWISLIIGWAVILAFMFLFLKVVSSHPGEFITRFGGQLAGRWLHKLGMVFYLFTMIYFGAAIIRELSDFLVLVYLPLTPIWAISLIFGICVILAVRSGVEVIFRAASGLLFIVVGIVVVIPFLLWKDLNWPIAGAFIRHWELQPILGGAVITVTVFELTHVLFIYPHLRNKEKTFRSLAIGSGCGMLLVFLTYMTCIMIFGVNLTSHLSYPTMEMFRMIRVGEFLDNMDPFFIGIWMMSLFIRVCFLLYIAVAGIGQILDLKHSKPLAFSVGAIMIGMSEHITENTSESQFF